MNPVTCQACGYVVDVDQGEAQPFWPEPDVQDYLCADTERCHVRVLVSQEITDARRTFGRIGLWAGILTGIVVGSVATQLGVWWQTIVVGVVVGTAAIFLYSLVIDRMADIAVRHRP